MHPHQHPQRSHRFGRRAAFSAWRPAGIAALAVVLAWATGCGADEAQLALDDARQLWLESAVTDYSFEYRRTCRCDRLLTEPMRVQVHDGTTLEAEFLEPFNVYPVPEQVVAKLETIDQMFQTIQDAFDQQANVATVTYDPRYGFPAGVYIDPDANNPFEDYSVTVSAFELLDEPPN